MPLTLDLVTDGMRHCPDPTRGRWDHEKIEEKLSDPIARLTFFQELETNIRNSTVVGRAATDDTPENAWETLVRIIQETTGCYFHQGAPRSTRPLALERRRLLKDLGTARRLIGVSADQTHVENAKIEVSRVEKQVRRLSRWLLRKRSANWFEELEEDIRKQDAFSVYRYARFLEGTGWPKGVLALHAFSWKDLQQEHLEYDGVASRGDSSRLCSHCETVEMTSSSSLMSTLVNTRSPLATSCVADLPAHETI